MRTYVIPKEPATEESSTVVGFPVIVDRQKLVRRKIPRRAACPEPVEGLCWNDIMGHCEL